MQKRISKPYHLDHVLKKSVSIFDIKIDYQGKIVFADLDRIYSMDINTLSVVRLADSYVACKSFLTQMTKVYVWL